MTQNIFTFSDLTFKQLNGTAMGTTPVPPYTTMYYGIHEEKLLPRYTQCIIFYCQFIDDVFGVWCPNKTQDLTRLSGTPSRQK